MPPTPETTSDFGFESGRFSSHLGLSSASCVRDSHIRRKSYHLGDCRFRGTELPLRVRSISIFEASIGTDRLSKNTFFHGAPATRDWPGKQGLAENLRFLAKGRQIDRP